MKEYWILKEIKEKYLHNKKGIERLAQKIEEGIAQEKSRIKKIEKEIEDNKGVMELKDIWTYIANGSNYDSDMDIAFFMFLGIELSGTVEISGEVLKMYSNIHNGNYGEPLGNKKGSEGRYGEDIEKYFPFAIKKKESSKIITKWCSDYQEVLWNQNNAEIFSINKEGIDISRYCFFKTERIYDLLKEKPVENLLISEMTLGFGVTNTVYSYLKNIDKVSQITKIESVLQNLCKIPGINLRNNIAYLVFRYLSIIKFFDDNTENNTEDIEKMLNNIQESVNKLYEYYLQLDGIDYFTELYKEDGSDFDKIEFLYRILDAVKTGQNEFWERSMFDKKPCTQQVHEEFCREYGILELEELLGKVEMCISLTDEFDGMAIEIFNANDVLGSSLFYSRNAFVSNFFDQFESRFFEDSDIIRAGDDSDKKFSLEEKNLLEEIYLKEQLVILLDALKEEIDRVKKEKSQNIKFKNDNVRETNTAKTISNNKKYAYLHKTIVYHLLNNMSSSKKIPANLR